MLVAACQVELYLPDCHSLKEKRYVLESLKTRIRQKFNVSVAEVRAQDKWQASVLGVSMVANDAKLLNATFNKILNLIEKDGRTEIVDQVFELV